MIFRSSGLAFDLGIEGKIKLPVSKYKNTGFFLGGKYGIISSPSKGNWKIVDRNTNVDFTSHDADFIPQTKATGTYWQITFGYFSVFRSR